MDIIDSTTFFNLTKSFEVVPFTQSRGMYEFHSLTGTSKIIFFVNSKLQPIIACFGHEKSFLNKKMILIEDECYANFSDINIKTIRNFFKEISSLGYDFVEICSSSKYNFDYETALRQAGFLRPVGQFSMPITKVIDLTRDITYSGNWRRNIKKAAQNNLIFEVVSDLKIKDCEDFISIYHEMFNRKSLSEQLTVEQIFALCQTSDFRLFFVSYNNKRIAAIIIHIKKTHGGSWFSATTNEALKLSASFFRHYALLSYLKEKGLKTFDLEKLVPSTNSTNNVFLFKNGIDGNIIQLNGEWAWYKRSYYRSLMYFVKKYLMKKTEL